MTKNIVLCADDYGQSLPISQAIIELISAQRLSAVSCLVNMKNSEDHGQWLKPYQDKVDIGLHFNLTEGAPLSLAYQKTYGDHFLSLTKLMYLALSRQLKFDVVLEECQAQINQFYAIYGFLPQFLDGHQHVHQFPIVQEAIIQLFNERLAKQSYLRLVKPIWCFTNLRVLFKQVVIFTSGMNAFRAKLVRHHILHNHSFSGIYHFSGNYGAWFRYFLRTINDQGLIMCHPSQDGVASDDNIAGARYQEYQYLKSNEFLEDCQRAKVNIRRFIVQITP